MVSIILSEYCLECWRLRNESLHGKDKIESREKKLAEIRKSVRKLYKKKHELGMREKKRLFSMPMCKRLNMGIQSTKLWVGMAEEVLRLHREKATQLTINQWLQP